VEGTRRVHENRPEFVSDQPQQTLGQSERLTYA